MKRWMLYADRHDAEKAHAAEGVIMSVTWAMLEWLFMDIINGESRLEYLKRCESLQILKSNGCREIKRLEKLQKAEAGE